MTEPTGWPLMDGADWQRRVQKVELIGMRWRTGARTPDDDDWAQRWLASIDPTAYIGSRHHTVPRWAEEASAGYSRRFQSD
jgi:hypothetical protein